MGALFVVNRDPFVGDFSGLIQIFKQIGPALHTDKFG
jgi:hypothetical protein